MEFTGLREQLRTLRGAFNEKIGRVLDHGLFIMGPEVKELEKSLEKFCGASRALSVANGTDALQIALMALGVGAGDLVFVPSFTYTATAEAILILGARPVFVEVSPETFNIDLKDLEARLHRYAHQKSPIKAIIGVDLFGYPADWAALSELAKRFNVALIADAAQSFGGSYQGKRVGTLADITTTSFFPAKPLGCFGDGGALFTEDAFLAEKIRSIRVHGQGKEKYETVRVGMNSRLDTLQAAILLAKLEVFEEELQKRQVVAADYTARLRHAVAVPTIAKGYFSAWAQYTILCSKRDVLATFLKERGIPTAVYYPKPMHLQEAYRAFGEGEGSLPISERLSCEVLSLPMNPYASEQERAIVCDAVLDGVSLL